MNKLDKQYEWVSWETSTHYCISQWDVASPIKSKWIKKMDNDNINDESEIVNI